MTKETNLNNSNRQDLYNHLQYPTVLAFHGYALYKIQVYIYSHNIFHVKLQKFCENTLSKLKFHQMISPGSLVTTSIIRQNTRK